MARDGREFMTVTPEFGPSLYAPLEAATGKPITDPWKSNHWMRDELRRRWGMN
jgi:hypothetical protein